MPTWQGSLDDSMLLREVEVVKPLNAYTLRVKTDLNLTGEHI